MGVRRSLVGRSLVGRSLVGRSLGTAVLAVAAMLGSTIAPALGVPAPRAGVEPIVNVEPPVLVGEATFGTVLHTTRGTWAPDGLTLTYRWDRDGTRIKGETGRFYRLGQADFGAHITATVTASDTLGNRLSLATPDLGPVRRARFVAEGPPTIRGEARFEHRLTATRGQWSKRPTRVRFRWLRDGAAIAGATAKTYRLRAEDVGSRVRVEVTVGRPGFVPATVRSSTTKKVGHRVPVRRRVTYHVVTRGRVTASLATFRRQVQQTYSDPRGWRSAGVQFRPTSAKGTFTVVLAEASTVPSFSSGCSATWSCRVGRYVIINQTRWLHATASWNGGRRSLRGYRHMVVNHETGHWLGHGHASCPGRGRLAPVMMQQSKGLAGCRHNPWPLASERWYSAVGRLAVWVA